MPKSQKKTGRRNKDWEKIKADYVTDPSLSLKKAAKKYGVPLRTIAEHSKADNWFAAKQEHQKQYCNELASKLHRKKLDSLEQELELAMNLSDRLFKVLNDDPEQFNRHLTTNIVTGDTEEKIFDKIDVKAMKDAVAVIKAVEDLKRSILGIQRLENIQRHEIERKKLEIDENRLEFEKEKTALRNGNTDDENNYGVVLMPEVIVNEKS